MANDFPSDSHRSNDFGDSEPSSSQTVAFTPNDSFDGPSSMIVSHPISSSLQSAHICESTSGVAGRDLPPNDIEAPSPSPPPPPFHIDGTVQGGHVEGELSTKPTWEVPTCGDADEENHAITESAPVVGSAASAAITTDAIGSSAPRCVGRDEGSDLSRSINDEPAKPEKPCLKIDTSAPLDGKPGEVGWIHASSPAESTLATELATPSSTVHTIEHRHVAMKGKKRSLALLSAMGKPAAALLGLYLVGVTGAGIFLAQKYATIPGLNQEIEALRNEVDRLETQVNRLESENDRFEQLNDELEANNEEYSAQNDRLEASNAYYAELNKQLNASNSDLERINGALNDSNEEYARLNQELTATTQKLNRQVDNLSAVNRNLSETLIEYVSLSEGLSNETDRLDQLNNDLSNNIQQLNFTVTDLRGENQRLRVFLDDLTTIVSFLNETTLGVEKSFEDLASFLSEQIVANQAILTETLHNTYRQRTIGWVCGLSNHFATEGFVSNGTVPIGSVAYPQVMAYINENVFEDLCLIQRDFESFLAARVGSGSLPPTNASLNQLIASVTTYSRKALDYYFPDAGEVGGLLDTDWADASFRCERLPSDKWFLVEKAL